MLQFYHKVRCECCEGRVYYEGDEEHEDREAGDGQEGEGEGGVEFDFLLQRPHRPLRLPLLAEGLLLHEGQHLRLAELPEHQRGGRLLLVLSPPSRSS